VCVCVCVCVDAETDKFVIMGCVCVCVCIPIDFYDRTIIPMQWCCALITFSLRRPVRDNLSQFGNDSGPHYIL